MKLSIILDFLKRHRLQIAVEFLVLGIILTGVRFPLPDLGLGLPSSFAFPVWFPVLVAPGKICLMIGSLGGGVAILTKWLKLAPDDSAKLAKAVADAARTGKPQTVETRADRPDVVVTPVTPQQPG